MSWKASLRWHLRKDLKEVKEVRWRMGGHPRLCDVEVAKRSKNCLNMKIFADELMTCKTSPSKRSSLLVSLPITSIFLLARLPLINRYYKHQIIQMIAIQSSCKVKLPIIVKMMISWSCWKLSWKSVWVMSK